MNINWKSGNDYFNYYYKQRSANYGNTLKMPNKLWHKINKQK